MDGHINGNNTKLTGIRQIVRLREILHKWQTVTLGGSSRSNGRGIAPAINNRVASIIRNVPKGYLAVYVGPELRRFIIPTAYLSHSLFKVLLEKAEEEFGFDHSGGLTIPCEIETFKFLLKCIEHHPKDRNSTAGDDVEDQSASK
ncbi:unnamed protein product [Linum tenue]|uniref:Uncharacterized protein n=1 Tax=Linum tenue TaxID=586396 RepID=A0AAV0HUC7_9ROSI|nr:unnamed protein product [Linum tenue]